MEENSTIDKKENFFAQHKSYFKYVAKRLGYAVITLWAVVTITFCMMQIVPGSPFAGEGKVSSTAQANMEAYYGLDKPLPVQYAKYLVSVATWDFGPSMTNPKLSPNAYISNNLPITMQLGIQATVVSVTFGLLLGIIAALFHNKFLDYFAMVFAIVGVSVPSFIMARLLVIVFAQNLGWFPVAQWNSFSSTILPTLALAFLPMAQIARLMRSSMLEVLGMDYIKTAKAKGLTQSAIIFKHAVRNAILPVVSMLGTTVAGLLTGSFVIEKIFAIPGMGDALIKSINNRDYPVIMAATVVYCIILIALTLFIDLIYPLIDPRIDIVKGDGVSGK